MPAKGSAAASAAAGSAACSSSSEVALSLLLLVGAGLLMRSFVALQTVDLGLDPENILVARVPLPRGQYTTAAEKQRFFRTLLDRLHALPGVVVATETTTLPPYGGIGTDIEIHRKDPHREMEGDFPAVQRGLLPDAGPALDQRPDVYRRGSRRRAQGRGRQSDTGQRGTSGRTIPSASASSCRCSKRFGRARSRIRSSKSSACVRDAKNQGIQEPASPEVFVPYTLTGALRARHPRADARRSRVAAQQRAPRDLGRRSQRGVDSHGLADRLPAAVLVRRTALLPGAAWRLRVGWPGAGGDRRLQRDRIHRVAPDPRDRHPHGARRAACERASDGRR